jgi:hypothetical protein
MRCVHGGEGCEIVENYLEAYGRQDADSRRFRRANGYHALVEARIDESP